MSDWKTASVKLTRPVTVGERTYTEIHFREPDVEAIEAIDDLGFEEGKAPTVRQSRELVTILADVPAEVIKKLHRVDFKAVQDAVSPLLEGDSSGATGDPSTPSSP